MKKYFQPWGPCLLILSLSFSISYLRAGIDTSATWTMKTGGPIYSSPTCDNGLVYIGSDDGMMYCLNGQTGSIKWRALTGGLIRCKPAIADTTLIFESDDGYLYAVNKISGSAKWCTYIGNDVKRVLPDPSTFTGNYWDYMQSSPCVDSGAVYVGSGDSSFYSVNTQTGTVRWKVKTGGIIRSSPCTYGGMVYVGSWDGYIYAFRKSDGAIVWKYNTASSSYKNVQPSPRVANGILYCGSRSGYFYALDAVKGTVIWTYVYNQNAPWVESSAAIARDVVYVGSSDVNRVYAFNAADGTMKWACVVPGDTWSSPCYDSGRIYIGLASYGSSATTQAGGALLAIDASTGVIRWRLDCKSSSFIGGVVSSPTVDKNLIYYGSLDGSVYAVDTAYTTPPKWCAADFSTMAFDGKQGFYVPRWSSGSITRIADRILGQALQGNASFSSSSKVFAVQRDSLPLRNGEYKANTVSLMINMPATLPDHGLVKFYIVNTLHDSVAVVDTIGTRVPKGAWTNLILTKLDSLERAGKFDLSKLATVGLSISYPAPFDTTTWTGTICLDNLWIYGISFPTMLTDGVTRSKNPPRVFHLYDNYPNPFNPATTIGYQVSRKSHITLRVYDMLGKEVATLVDDVQPPGEYKVFFDGSHLSSGIYFNRLISETACETKTMALIK